MDADLDTLATALYVKIDDELKIRPELGRSRPEVGLCPKLSDAELLTLAVIQALLGFSRVHRSATPAGEEPVVEAEPALVDVHSQALGQLVGDRRDYPLAGRGLRTVDLTPDLVTRDPPRDSDGRRAHADPACGEAQVTDLERGDLPDAKPGGRSEGHDETPPGLHGCLESLELVEREEPPLDPTPLRRSDRRRRARGDHPLCDRIGEALLQE